MLMLKRRLVQHDEGFTVVEAVVAAAILLITAVAIMQVFAFASTSTESNRTREEATELANERIEQARNLAYDKVGTIGGDPVGNLQESETVGKYQVSTDVSWARDTSTGRATYKHVAVVVAWNEPVASRVELTTNVYGQSNLVNTGDLVLTLVEKATGKGLKDVSVKMNLSSGGSRTVKTDANGEAFFGFVPTGTMTFEVAPSGYIVDLTTINGAVVTNDMLTRVTLMAEKPAAVTAQVRTPSGAAINGATFTLTQVNTTRVYTAVSDSSGNARFTGLYPDKYTLRARILGRASGTVSFDLTAGTDQTQIVTLADPGTQSIRVTDANNVKLNGATVTLTNKTTGAKLTGTTASSGEVSFNIPDEATYTIIATLGGYVAGSTENDLSPSGGPLITIPLHVPQAGTITVYNTGSKVSFRPYKLSPAGWAAAAVSISKYGTGTFANLAPGDYRVYYANTSSSTPSGSSYLSATIVDGETINLTK